MSSDFAPILIFGFNRPDKLSQLLGSLQGCPEFGQSQVRVFIDGPRSATEAERVAQTRAVAEACDHPHLEIRARETNAGLKASIMAGVTETLEQHDSAIILEDDLVLSPHALRYFNQGLQRFAGDDRVWSISGYMYDVPALQARDAAFFVPFPHPWGWATWARPWQQFVQATPDRSQLSSDSFRQWFDVLGLRDFSSILDLDQAGLVNSWYVNWYLEMFLNGGLTLAPPVSMVRNGGLTEGTHASGFSPYRLLRTCPPIATEPPALPDRARVDFHALDAIRSSRDARVQKGVSQLGRVKRRLKAGLKTRRGQEA